MRARNGFAALAVAAMMAGTASCTATGSSSGSGDVTVSVCSWRPEDAATYKQIYGVPLEMSTFQIYYNKAVFPKYQLQPPATWAQRSRRTETRRRRRDAVCRRGQGHLAAAAVQGHVRRHPVRRAQAPIRTINPDLDLGVFTVPPAPGAVVDRPPQVGWVDASYGLNAKSAHPQEALELLQWMTTAEFGRLVADNLKQIPLIKGVQSNDPLLRQIVSSYRSNPTPYLMLVDFRYGIPLGSDLEATGLQKMLPRFI